MRRSHDRAPLFGMPRETFDWTLFLTASALAVIGVINLYSATSVARAALSEIYVQQVYWLVLGGILSAVVAVIDYRHYERLGYLLYGIGIIFLILVFILGKDIRGSSRWIAIGSFGFQPSEFMKLFLIIALAKYLHDDPKSEGRSLKDLAGPALLTLVPAALIFQQPDLGTALVHVFDGELQANGHRGASGDMLVFERSAGTVRLTAGARAQALILGGQPLGEPVVRYGPFVMNSREEIIQAFRDYESGSLARSA